MGTSLRSGTKVWWIVLLHPETVVVVGLEILSIVVDPLIVAMEKLSVRAALVATGFFTRGDDGWWQHGGGGGGGDGRDKKEGGLQEEEQTEGGVG